MTAEHSTRVAGEEETGLGFVSHEISAQPTSLTEWRGFWLTVKEERAGSGRVLVIKLWRAGQTTPLMAITDFNPLWTEDQYSEKETFKYYIIQ